MQLWVLLITAMVPLAITPGLLSAFDITPKIAILLFCESALLLFCKQLVNCGRALFESPVGRLYTILLAAQWISVAMATWWSSNRMLSVAGSSWRRDGLIVQSAILLFAWITAAWFIEDRSRIRVVLRAAMVAGIIAALYGIAQYFGWDPLLPSHAYQSGEGPFTITRPPGTMGHADYFANWLVIVVFFALALIKLEGVRDWKIAARFCLGLGSLAVLLSGTRSALLGLLVGSIVFTAIARPRVDRKTILIIAGTVTGLVLLYISSAGAMLRARVHWSLDDLRGGARMLLWRDSFQMAIRKPFLGFGPETFTAQFPPFESVELSRAYPDFYHESAHNMFLDALTSCGILGAILLLALSVLAAWAARKNAALAGGIAGALVCQQFVVLTVPTALYFYLLLSVIIASAVPVSQFEHRRIPRVIFPIAAASAVVFLVYAIRLVLADRAIAIGEKRVVAGDVRGAVEEHQIARRWGPFYGEADLNYSRAMTRLATTTSDFATSAVAAQQATESAIRATESSEDRQNAWYNLATMAALRNDQKGVEDGLRQAIAAAPNWFKPHWTLAQLLELTGRHAEARREAAIGAELDGGHDPEVTETARRILSWP